MQNFVNTFGDLCSFTFLSGELDVTWELPIQYFVDKGIKPPYKSWYRFPLQKVISRKEDGTMSWNVNRTESLNFGVTNAIEKIVKVMKEQDEPFDGIASFSQGGFMAAILLKAFRYQSKKFNTQDMIKPYFWIDFAVPRPFLGTWNLES